jgi:hypothetical protein
MQKKSHAVVGKVNTNEVSSKHQVPSSKQRRWGDAGARGKTDGQTPGHSYQISKFRSQVPRL